MNFKMTNLEYCSSIETSELVHDWNDSNLEFLNPKDWDESNRWLVNM